ncbi:hypothetical protein DRQ25_01590 [Candidatus Fermentibacteria bacterium]|nr:MAG: hypothetical protein DRQ25_01590 [Candidatus Fermentibacteria bacterium]
MNRFKYWLIMWLIGRHTVIANAMVYDTCVAQCTPIINKDNIILNFEDAAGHRAMQMVEKHDNEKLYKQGVQRYGNSFVLRNT